MSDFRPSSVPGTSIGPPVPSMMKPQFQVKANFTLNRLACQALANMNADYPNKTSKIVSLDLSRCALHKFSVNDALLRNGIDSLLDFKLGNLSISVIFE